MTAGSSIVKLPLSAVRSQDVKQLASDHRRLVSARDLIDIVRAYCDEHRVSERELCRRAGKSNSLIIGLKAAAERGGTSTFETVQLLAIAMNTSVAYLAGETDDPNGLAPLVATGQVFEAAAMLYEAGVYPNGATFAADLTVVCDWLESGDENKIGDLTPQILNLLVKKGAAALK